MEAWQKAAASIVVALVAVFVLGYVYVWPELSSNEESTSSIETDIEAAYAKQVADLGDESLTFDPVVECPDTAPMGSGDSFICLLSDDADAGATVASIKVKFQNGQGDYYWRVEN